MIVSRSLFRFLIVFYIFVKTEAQDEYDFRAEELSSELTLINLELRDECQKVSNARETSLVTNTFDQKTHALKHYGHFVQNQSQYLKIYEDEEIPSDIEKTWNIMLHPGDALLEEKDWDSVIEFDRHIDELLHTVTVNCKANSSCLYVKKGYDDSLENSRNATLLKKTWEAWQKILSLTNKQYPNILHRTNKAAKWNGHNNVRSYWEMLTEYEDGYAKAEYLWQQIEPFYIKLKNTVKNRLFHFHKINSSSDAIPVYLLGSNFGFDWSNIADIILPHPQLHYDAETFLRSKSVRDIYKMAEGVTQQLSLGELGEKFWDNSRFNMTFCENHVISFYEEEYSEVLSCNRVSWKTYLDALEVALDVASRNVDYTDLAVLDLRYSIVDEAVKGLSPILAVENLIHDGIWPTNQSENEKMSALFLIALRTLPRLPYYLIADRWRLDLLKNGYIDMEEKWWKLRKEIQGVEGVFNNESDYIGDSLIRSNKPYLNKFLGTFMTFQILDNYHNLESQEQHFIKSIGADESLINVLKERATTDRQTSLSNHWSIYDITADFLLSYFSPLEAYLDAAPMEQQAIVTAKPETKAKVIKKEATQSIVASTESTLVTHHPSITHHTVGPEPHRHFHEDLQEGDNPAMEQASLYIGIGLLMGVVVVIVFAVVAKRLAKRKRTNNRRFEA